MHFVCLVAGLKFGCKCCENPLVNTQTFLQLEFVYRRISAQQGVRSLKKKWMLCGIFLVVLRVLRRQVSGWMMMRCLSRGQKRMEHNRDGEKYLGDVCPVFLVMKWVFKKVVLFFRWCYEGDECMKSCWRCSGVGGECVWVWNGRWGIVVLCYVHRNNADGSVKGTSLWFLR